VVEVKIESNNVMMDCSCSLCGRDFELSGITAVLYIDGKSEGDICPNCFKGGQAGIRKQLQKHVAELREQSTTIVQEMLDHAAEDEKLTQGEIICPSQAEWDRLYGKWIEHCKG
jgi:ribosome-binding protein aMBF1 (putative translation factor)